MRRLLLALPLATISLVWAGSAHAALTDAERAQARQLVVGADPAQVGRVRSLVGRPDLDEDESSSALVDAMRATPFDARHESFLRDLLFGPASAAARTSLAAPVVRAVLARAEAVLAAHPSDLERHLSGHREQRDELLRLHAFVAREVASAGSPPAEGHDARAGVRDDALRSAVAAYRAHLDRTGGLMTYARAVPGSLAPVRAQAATALGELASGLFTRHEVGGWLGLSGARLELFEQSGTLLDDAGTAGDARVAAVAAIWRAFPAAAGADLVVLRKHPAAGVWARGAWAHVRADLGDDLHPMAADALWPAAVFPARPDVALAETALAAAEAAAARVLSARPSLRARVDRALARAVSVPGAERLALDMAPPALDAEGVSLRIAPAAFVARAARLVAIDVPRAIDLAATRALGGHPELVEQLALGLTLLATPADAAQPALTRLRAGVTRDDGSIAPVEVTDVRVDGAGVVEAFTLAGAHYQLGRPSEAAAILRDGKPLGPASLPRARVARVAGERWSDATRTYVRLFGSPRVALLEEGHLEVASEPGGSGFDAVGCGDAGVDAIEGVVQVSEAGGLGLRGTAGTTSWRGVALFVDTATPPRVHLVAVDGQSQGWELAHPLELAAASPEGRHLRLVIRGAAIEGTADGVRLTAAVPAGYAQGVPFVAAKDRGEVEVSHLVVGAPASAKKSSPPPHPAPKRAPKSH